MRAFPLALLGLLLGTTSLAAQHAHHPMPAQTPTPAASPATSTPAPMMMHDSGGMGMNAMPASMMMHDSGGMGMNTMGMMDTMMALMPPVLRFAPGRLLERAQDLDLTPVQAGRLTEISRRVDVARDSLATLSLGHARALRQTLQADEPDRVAADAHLDALQMTMGAMHRVMMGAALEARSVLRPDQRARIEAAGAAAPRSDSQGGGHQH